MAEVTLQSLTKRFGKTVAVDQVDLVCDDGRVLALLGPSGAGKTTTLRVTAGLVAPTSGRVLIGGRDVTLLEPADRNIAMAFESYALYPHLSVYENLAFPLRSPRASGRYTAHSLDERVRTIARLLQIDMLLERMPTELSGGQKQRVALGRALVREPNVFLLDEPIAHLDARLRNLMHAELKRIQRQFGTTTIYATPDYAEAMAMADRVALMVQGRIVQIGEPLDVYHHPVNTFVAQFMSEPPMNLLAGEVHSSGGQTFLRISQHAIPVDGQVSQRLMQLTSRQVRVGVRPTDVAVSSSPSLLDEGGIRADVLVVEPSERVLVAMLRVDQVELKLKVPASTGLKPREPAYVRFDPSKFYIFDSNTGETLVHATHVDTPVAYPAGP